MPSRFRPSRAFADGILLHDADDAENPTRLYFDYERFKGKPLSISVRNTPHEPGGQGGDALQEWTWTNGPAGAGTTIETPQSYGDGACEHGLRVWLRRKGVATAAGALVEYQIAATTAALTDGQFTAGQVYDGSLWLTTLGRTVIQVPGAGLGTGTLETDFGVGAQTTGLAVFAGTGASCLYVGEFNIGIREYNGSVWATGAVGTGRAWLETPHWTIGSQLATGGAAGGAGEGATRLVGTNQTSTGFYHISGDPKVAGNWSSLETIGSGGTKFPIIRTAASNRNVWFGTGLGVIAVDQLGYDPNLTKWMEMVASINNCSALAFWNGLIWAAAEAGLMVFSPNGERIDLGQYVQFGARTGAGPIFGRPIALCPTPDGLQVAYYNTAEETSYVGCLLIDPDQSYRWSMAEAVLPGQIVTYLQQVVSTGGDPGLFIGTVDTTTSKLRLHRQYLPKYGDPLTDTLNGGPFVAATDWEVTLSRSDGGRAVSKTFERYSLEADYLGTGYPDNTVAFKVAADGGDFTTIGSATRSSRWTSTPTAPYVRATDFQVRLVAHNAATQPIVVRTVGVRYEPHPEQQQAKTYPVVFAEGHTGYDPQRALRQVERAQAADPATYTDQFGRTFEGTLRWIEEEITQEAPGKSWQVHGSITVTVNREVTTYDDGYAYDNGEPYS